MLILLSSVNNIVLYIIRYPLHSFSLNLQEMNALILDEAVLMLQRLYRGDIFNLAVHEQQRGEQRTVGEERKRFRHAAYRQFILWQHGRLGRGNRRVVPSCCVLTVRDRYPDPLGHYVGFKHARLN